MKTHVAKTERYFPDITCRAHGCKNVTFSGDFCPRCTEEIESLEKMTVHDRRWGAVIIYAWGAILALALLGGVLATNWVRR